MVQDQAIKPIRKVVIPAAGFGTRFLPQTKAMPKEMLPVVDKPIIQYVVEEAVAAGIEDIIIVTGYNKRSIEDHFDRISVDLSSNLKSAGKTDLLEQTKKISELANFIYIRQKGPYGNGTPILNARHLIGNEPFAIMWGDEFIYSDPPRLKQMVDVWQRTGKPNVSAVRIEDKNLDKYGIADVDDVEPGIFKINHIVEKPKPGEAPSNLAAHGAWIMPPRLFDLLAEVQPGKGGEIWLQDAITKLAQEQDVYAVEIQNGKYYDTGNKLDYLKTVVDFALMRDDIKDDFEQFLRGRIA